MKFFDRSELSQTLSLCEPNRRFIWDIFTKKPLADSRKKIIIKLAQLDLDKKSL